MRRGGLDLPGSWALVCRAAEMQGKKPLDDGAVGLMGCGGGGLVWPLFARAQTGVGGSGLRLGRV